MNLLRETEIVKMCENCIKKLESIAKELGVLDKLQDQDLKIPEFFKELPLMGAPLILDMLTGKSTLSEITMKGLAIVKKMQEADKLEKELKDLISKKGIRSFTFADLLKVFADNPNAKAIAVSYKGLVVSKDEEGGLIDTTGDTLELSKGVLETLYVLDTDLELVRKAKAVREAKKTTEVMVSLPVAMQALQQGSTIRVDYTTPENEVVAMTLSPGATIPFEALSGVFYVNAEDKK